VTKDTFKDISKAEGGKIIFWSKTRKLNCKINTTSWILPYKNISILVFTKNV
jgi:hypothetical protein